MIKEIGFIGLGTVGKHMALNLLKGNYRLTVYDSQKDTVKELVTAGATAAPTPFAAAKGRDLVMVILPELEEREAALGGENSFLKGIDPGTILADMGTHSLEATRELAAQAGKARVMFLEAPVWGTKEHAASGLLTLLVGGDPSLLSRCREAFSFFALNIIHIGEIGEATRMKFVVNLVQAELMEALAEGLVFGEKLGFRGEKILEVLESSGVASPLFNAKGRSIARGDFSRNLALKYVREGLQAVQKVALQHQLDLPGMEATLQVYDQAVADGRGEEDFSAIVKVLRK